MCTSADFAGLSLEQPWAAFIQHELVEWHDYYLPVPEGGTVLDVGAGCGETAHFYLLHGAGHIIAIESDPRALAHLHRNFGGDPRVTILAAELQKIKIDIEGAEENMDLEVHFPYEWDTRRVVGNIAQMRLLNKVRVFERSTEG